MAGKARSRPAADCRQVLGLVTYMAGSCLVWHLAASRTACSMPPDAIVLAHVDGACDDGVCRMRQQHAYWPAQRGSSRAREGGGGGGVDSRYADFSGDCAHAPAARHTLLGRRFPLAQQQHASCFSLRTCATAAASEADCEGPRVCCGVHSSTGRHARSSAPSCETQGPTGRPWRAPVARLRGGTDDAFFEGYNALKPNDFGQNGHIYQVPRLPSSA